MFRKRWQSWAKSDDQQLVMENHPGRHPGQHQDQVPEDCQAREEAEIRSFINFFSSRDCSKSIS